MKKYTLYLADTDEIVGEYDTEQEVREAMEPDIKYELVSNRRRYPMDDDNQNNQKNVCKKS